MASMIGSVLAVALAFGSPAPAPGPQPQAGQISGVVTDTEVPGVRIPGAQVTALCPCRAEPLVTVTEPDGSFELTDLGPGTYTIVVDRGGPATRQVVSTDGRANVDIELAVAPPFATVDVEHRRRHEQRTDLMLAVGTIATLAGLMMLVGTAVEGRKPPCRSGLDDCDDAPRPGAIKGLAVGAAAAGATGLTLLGVGITRRLQLRAQMRVEQGVAAFGLRGRF